MDKIKLVLTLALIVALTACTTVSNSLTTTYLTADAESLQDEDLAIIWRFINTKTSLHLREVNESKPKVKGARAKTKVLPGSKSIKMSSSRKYRGNKGKRYELWFADTFEAKAGYSYNFKVFDSSLRSLNLLKLPKICIYEELHDAEGSKIGWANEVRTPSKSAKKISCTRGVIKEL